MAVINKRDLEKTLNQESIDLIQERPMIAINDCSK